MLYTEKTDREVALQALEQLVNPGQSEQQSELVEKRVEEHLKEAAPKPVPEFASVKWKSSAAQVKKERGKPLTRIIYAG
jgi:hypothetical protein